MPQNWLADLEGEAVEWDRSSSMARTIAMCDLKNHPAWHDLMGLSHAALLSTSQSCGSSFSIAT